MPQIHLVAVGVNLLLLYTSAVLAQPLPIEKIAVGKCLKVKSKISITLCHFW